MEQDITRGIEGRLSAALSVISHPYKMLFFWGVTSKSSEVEEIREIMHSWVKPKIYIPTNPSEIKRYGLDLCNKTIWITGQPSEKEKRSIKFVKSEEGYALGDSSIALGLQLEKKRDFSLYSVLGGSGPALNGILPYLTRVRILELISRGFNTPRIIAENSDIVRGTVRPHIASLVQEGLLERGKKGEVYMAPKLEAFVKEDLPKFRKILQGDFTESYDIAMRLRETKHDFIDLISSSIEKFLARTPTRIQSRYSEVEKKTIDYLRIRKKAAQTEVATYLGKPRIEYIIQRLQRKGLVKCKRKNTLPGKPKYITLTKKA